MNGTSTDGLRDVTACPATTRWQRLPAALDIELDYPKGCAVSFFGRDMACMANQYQSTGRLHSAAWVSFLEEPARLGLYPSPLIHDVDTQTGKPLVLIVWRDRLSVPAVIAMPSGQEVPPL